MIRKYGSPPYRVAVLHGGPGALGSVAEICMTLSEDMGVLEPLQSKYSITELIEELNEQINFYCDEPIALIGHSWGAWLAILYANRYPFLVRQIILVGCAPFEDKYVSKIAERRLANLSGSDRIEFKNLLLELENSIGDKKLIDKLENMVRKTDNYDVDFDSSDNENIFETDEKMYNTIWTEAAQLRSTGELIKEIERIKHPLHIIHGNYDPHPLEGVITPLKEQGVNFDYYLLENCGHSPFREKQARADFYCILRSIINQEVV